MDLYFIKFPQMYYSNTVCKNITRRVTLPDNVSLNSSLFYRYEVKFSTRPDVISENYYEDSTLDWLIFLNNGIIDPYYGWTMNDDEFDSFIEKKYGSIEIAKKKIKFYQLNWPTDETEISVSYFDNNLPGQLKKYYSPIFSNFDTIMSYKRKKEDLTINTNRILEFSLSSISGNGFSVGEIVDIYNPSQSQVIGGAEVIFSNNSVIKVHNISGNTSATNKVKGETSNTLATISSTLLLNKNIPDDEIIFWSPIYFYEYEMQINEKNKNIYLLKKEYSSEISEAIKNKLQE